ncbi:hypothetical protein [Burkholderia vietnamiensis]|uniref:hypothetical protein n=1 Tax=Burkholderia vietnamiensis TaxID=60552 RepID=UPI001594B90F|nr:hypothetical protein [Burkholderia vietnamiensis]
MPNNNVLTDKERRALSSGIAALEKLGWTDPAGILRTLLADDPGRPEPRAEVTAATCDVLAERRRQVEQEGWTPEHDDAHLTGDLALAAACYAIQGSGRWAHNSFMWPWPSEWWKPTKPRRDLVKAGALILAELERLDRAGEKS